MQILNEQEVMTNHKEIVANTLICGDCLEVMKNI